jgi:hypothetical protein
MMRYICDGARSYPMYPFAMPYNGIRMDRLIVLPVSWDWDAMLHAFLSMDIAQAEATQSKDKKVGSDAVASHACRWRRGMQCCRPRGHVE